MKIKVLDHIGYIELVDTLGDDLTPVNAARVSFGGKSDKFSEKDKRLSKFLIKHKHFSPFRHQHIQVIIKAPEFVLRQWYKHVVGIETTSSSVTKDHAWNEISGRYIPVQEFYQPDVWRKIEETYKRFVNMGMAKEQARIILPLSQYTLVYWTASFQSVMNFIELRDESTAQWEIQQYAKALKEIMLETFPETTKLWSETYWEK